MEKYLNMTLTCCFSPFYSRLLLISPLQQFYLDLLALFEDLSTEAVQYDLVSMNELSKPMIPGSSRLNLQV